jgi:hypothetical protein
MPERPHRRPSLARALLVLCRNLLFAVLLYGLVVGVILLAKSPSRSKGRLGIPAVLDKSGPADILGTTRSGVTVKFAASRTSVTINPHANVFNRPVSLVIAKDDFLGPRPHVDTVADMDLLVSECRGSAAGMENVRNVFNCLGFLDSAQDRYFTLPPVEQRASQANPQAAEYHNADRLNNTSSKYSEAVAPSARSIGTCAGPVIPYHTYWTGPATWRLEMFIKSYLYTQNLACSRLHIWLDEDHRTASVSRMMSKDPLFARFLPFVERGDIVLETWTFPLRIPLARHEANAEHIGYYKNPAKPNSKGETTVADGIMEDAAGQQWLVLTPKEMALVPQPVSEAVRYIVLHLRGGIFLEVDVLLLRDMRPLMLARNHNFASRWAAYPHPGDFANAVLALSANSSLSSYLLHGAIRMGLNFHPRVVGRMAWKDGRDAELVMLETAAFDPLWTEFGGAREGRCAVPCLRDYAAAFKGRPGALRDEWASYDGPQGEPLDDVEAPPPPAAPRPLDVQTKRQDAGAEDSTLLRPSTHAQKRIFARAAAPPPPTEQQSPGPFAATSAEEAELRRAGAIADYRAAEDRFPPNNRTLEHFFRGAWAYHVRNHAGGGGGIGAGVDASGVHPEPASWLAVVERAHDGFFAGTRRNAYGERWAGPEVMRYYLWPEFV